MGVAFHKIRGLGCPGKQGLIFTNSKIKCPPNALGIFSNCFTMGFSILD